MLLMIVMFVIGLLVGFFLIREATCKKTVYAYPSLENVKKRVYKDDRGKCYQYYPVDMDCPKNKYSDNN